MTARQIWKAALIELSKINAPSLLLSEYNYYINKAIQQYINKQYNIYDINQQTSDSLRVLKSEATLVPTDIKDPIFKATYTVTLPSDYIHLLNCVCIYTVNGNYECYDDSNVVAFAARRLTSDSWSRVMDDYYNRPLPERPYYYIHNVNQQVNLPTNQYSSTTPGSTDQVWTGTENTSEGYTSKVEFPRVITLNGESTTVVNKPAGLRHANASGIRMEIRYGYDNRVFTLSEVRIDYIKAPQFIRLTKEQVDQTQDTSQIMEFPDYVCNEIINELVRLLMHRDADPRLQSQPSVTESIANPAQQQAAQQQPQQRGS